MVALSVAVARADRRAATLWLLVFAPGFVFFFIACTALSAMVPQMYGDLTRIGMVSERLFGWKEAQPDIPKRLRKPSVVTEADVLVVGDSFSGSLTWQAALAQSGLKVATTGWPAHGLCMDLDQWLSSVGFKGKTVIAETVERYASARVAQGQTCTMQDPINEPPLEPLKQPRASYSLGVGAGVRVNLQILKNTRRAERLPFNLVLDNPSSINAMRVAVVNVQDGCSRFSHPLCSKALFLTEDVERPPLTATDAAGMARIAESVKAANLVWVIVPNKSTVYLQPERSADFRRAFNDRRLGPDLFARANAGKDAIRDLYWANDTHWSTAGHLYFGAAVHAWLR